MKPPKSAQNDSLVADSLKSAPMQPASTLLDYEIRDVLKEFLREQDDTAAIFDELPLLRGRGRADLAFVNGRLWGYEIKSEADSLVRAEIQADNYESVFEFNTIVAATKHLTAARKRLPESWGIIEVKRVNGRAELHPRRQAKRNLKLSNFALARLLWKNECLAILRKMRIETRPRMSISKLWLLLETMGTSELCDEVRIALKRRQMKAVLRQTPDDDSRTIATTE